MRILGIDPGYGRMGWGVIEGEKSTWQHVAHGCVETKADISLPQRLAQIHAELQKIIKKYSPDYVGVEELFFYKNVTTAIDVGQARGVILLTLTQAKLPIAEFTPLEVKQAITGYGRADKTQMIKMVNLQFGLKNIIQDDAADALAVALTAGVTRA